MLVRVYGGGQCFIQNCQQHHKLDKDDALVAHIDEARETEWTSCRKRVDSVGQGRTLANYLLLRLHTDAQNMKYSFARLS